MLVQCRRPDGLLLLVEYAPGLTPEELLDAIAERDATYELEVEFQKRHLAKLDKMVLDSGSAVIDTHA